MAQEGCGTSNAINYAYSFTSKRWFGSYECRVHRVFLSAPTEIFTKKFTVGIHAWQLRLIHKDDKMLAAYLYARNQAAVPVRFSFTLVNHNDVKQSKAWGDVRTIQGGTCWGFGRLADIASVQDAKTGFLSGDVFTVRVDLRLKLEENESSSFITNKNSGVYTWRLKDLSGMSPWVFVTEEFSIGRLKWQLQFHPTGQKQSQRHASIFLYSHNSIPAKVKLEITAVNSTLGIENFSKSLEYRFKSDRDGRGWYEFLELSALQDVNFGFLEDGWLTLTAHIAVESQTDTNTTSRTQDSTEPVCIFCLDKPQTSGVLHGNSTHKCYCQDCAILMKRRQENLNCPICGKKVDRIIERFF